MNNKDKQALFNSLNVANKWGIPPLVVDGIIGPKSNFAFGYASHMLPGWENTSQMALAEDGLKPAPRPYFVDSLSQVTPQRIELLQSEVGALPFAWGRYIDGVTPLELELLRSHGIKWLPISRRSGEVAGDRALGARSGARDASIVARLADGKVATTRCVYLDVEGNNVPVPNPKLSAEYWRGWSSQWEKSIVYPAVYMPNQHNHGPWWDGLNEACSGPNPAQCGGAWVAWYMGQTIDETNNGTGKFFPFEWHPIVEAHSPVATIAHQYAGNCYGKRYDFNITKGEPDTL